MFGAWMTGLLAHCKVQSRTRLFENPLFGSDAALHGLLQGPCKWKAKEHPRYLCKQAAGWHSMNGGGQGGQRQVNERATLGGGGIVDRARVPPFVSRNGSVHMRRERGGRECCTREQVSRSAMLAVATTTAVGCHGRDDAALEIHLYPPAVLYPHLLGHPSPGTSEYSLASRSFAPINLVHLTVRSLLSLTPTNPGRTHDISHVLVIQEERCAPTSRVFLLAAAQDGKRPNQLLRFSPHAPMCASRVHETSSGT